MEVISILLCTIMALFAYIRGKTTLVATVISWILGLAILLFGGYQSFFLLFILFFVITLAEKIKKAKRTEIVKEINQKIGKRDTIQVLSNISIGVVSLLLYFIFDHSIFYIAYACIMATSLSDTLGSEIGVLSNEDPIDIRTLKKQEKGISGGVTLLGLFASLVGAFIIGISFYLLNGGSINQLIFIVIIGLIGSLIDSLYGSIFQVKYRCNVCDIKTEKETHCEQQTEYIKGFKRLNNDLVNFATTLDVFIISIILLSLS